MTALALVLALTGAGATPLTGVWSGMLNFAGSPLLFVMTIAQSHGKLTATATSPYQSDTPIAVDTLSSDDGTLSFTIEKLGVTYKGTIGNGSISGTFTQNGISVPLVMTPSSVGTSDLGGTWLGSLALPNGSLLLALHVTHADGGLAATLDSPYQKGFSIPVTSIASANGSLTFAIGSLKANYTGKIGPTSIAGTFTQNGERFPLTFARP